MVFPLQASTLEEAYPMRVITESSTNNPPMYDDLDQLEYLAKELKPFQKLRIVDDKLEVDLRFPQYMYRKRTGDSRQKTLDKLKEYKYSESLIKIVELLCTTTYKNDTVFIEECNVFYNKRNILKPNK